MTFVLYRCYDADGALLYIGQTNNLANRMRMHGCDAAHPGTSRELLERLARTTTEDFSTREEARAAEVDAIRAEGPLLNRQHNTGRWVQLRAPRGVKRRAA